MPIHAASQARLDRQKPNLSRQLSRRLCREADYWRISSHQNTAAPPKHIRRHSARTFHRTRRLHATFVVTLICSVSCTTSLPLHHPPPSPQSHLTIPQRWLTATLTPWRSTPSALSRYVLLRPPQWRGPLCSTAYTRSARALPSPSTSMLTAITG